jgi:hypothetical protein
MRAGVNECGAEPVMREELYSALQTAAQRPARKHGDVFAVIGAKGGIGIPAPFSFQNDADMGTLVVKTAAAVPNRIGAGASFHGGWTGDQRT